MVNGKKLIGLCSSRIYDPQIHGYIKDLNEKLQGENCSLLIFAINSDIYWEEDAAPAETYVFDIMPYEELDCVIIMDEKIKSHKVANRIIERSKACNVPVIVVDGSYEGTISISFDYASGFEKVVRHLIEDHHAKRPHIMAGLPNNFFSDQRIDIFKKVIAENGISFDDSMLSYGHFWADPTREAMQEILKRDELPDAIICANDIMALNVCDMLDAAGISVPDRVLVSGFDGLDEVFHSKPRLTTVSCDTIQLAAATGDTVLKIIHGESVTDTYIIPELITNESCGCPTYELPQQNILTRLNSSFYRHQDDTRILYSISSRMETSETPWDMAASIHCHQAKNSLCVVDRNCFLPEKNYFLIPEDEMQPRDLHMINESEYAEEHRFEHLPLPEDLFYDESINKKESILSGNYRDRIIELTNSDYPLIFNALDYMNRPFGFNCYYYANYTVTNYSRAAIVTNAVSMGVGSYVNLTHQRFLLQKMDCMYKHDALTGLYNRTGFLFELRKKLEDPEYYGKDITAIMSDLDDLKYINDNYGHAEGDMAIQAAAEALLSACPEHALCVRYGGDEVFAVVFGECDTQAIIKAAEDALNSFNRDSGLPYVVSTSIGAYTTTFSEDFDVAQALRSADQEMYKVKNNKKKQL